MSNARNQTHVAANTRNAPQAPHGHRSGRSSPLNLPKTEAAAPKVQARKRQRGAAAVIAKAAKERREKREAREALEAESATPDGAAGPSSAAEAGPSDSAAASEAADDEDEVEVTGTRTREERDAELRKQAVDVDPLE